MSDPIIPPAQVMITPAIDTIVSLRPEALAHFNAGGRWADLPAMWRAQIQRVLSRIGSDVLAARLKTATGDELRQLCASEFNTVLPPAPQPSWATVSLTRSGTAPGVIRAGTKFTKLANPDAQPVPIDSASYQTVATTYIASGQSSVTLSLTAVQPGASGNVPTFSNAGLGAPTSIQPSKPLFDSTFSVVSCSAAGGSSGLTDPTLVAAAKAYAIGQFGATDGALLAGALQQQSVRSFAAFRAGSLPYAQAYVADQSWASNTYWTNQVAQFVSDNWRGFGCRIRWGTVTNLQIAIAPTITLKTTDALAFTDQIDANVRLAAEAYFNGRPDWYRWHAVALQAVISKADSRILQCTGVTVTDAITGSAVAEPANTFGQTWSPTLTHFFLTDRSVTATYSPPN